MEVTKAYFAKQADEITLQQADIVLVLQEEDGECGWGHPSGCQPDTAAEYWAAATSTCSACLVPPPKNFEARELAWLA